MAICVGVLGRSFSPQCIDYEFDLTIDGDQWIKNILYVK
jgi:hypothetical protein